MVWEEIEQDEQKLLEGADHDARQEHYHMYSLGLYGYVIAVAIVLALMLFVWWLAINA